MAEILENAAHLAQTIGARPAGTEEERQAALYLSEAFQRKAGLPTEVEDFNCPTDFELPRAIYCIIAVALTIITYFIPVLVLIALIATLVLAALYAVETLVRPLLASVMTHGASQNVVARYEPAPAEGASRAARQRKIVLVSHYDTGKVRAELSPALVPLLPIIHWVELGGMGLLALLLLVRLASAPVGAFAVVVNVLTVISCIAAILPAVVMVVHRMAAYTEGANCNASGVAVLIEVAERLKKGRARAEELRAMEVRIHGEEAARESGLVPEGASVSYQAEPTEEPSDTAEDRLMAAKAAVAMLTGRPVSATVNIDLDEQSPEEIALAQDEAALAAEEARLQAVAEVAVEAADEMAPEEASPEPTADTASDQPVTFSLGNAAAAPAQPVAAEAPALPSFMQEEPEDNVPDWFKAARAKARKTTSDSVPVVSRSRYAQAAEVAQEAIDAHNAQAAADAAAQAELQNQSETEARLAQVRESIMEAHPARSAKGAGDGGRDEARTMAFAPTQINGEELKREAERQKRDGDLAEAQPVAAEPQAVEEAPAPQVAAAVPSEPAAAEPSQAVERAGDAGTSAKAADTDAAARIDSLRKSIPLVGASEEAAPAGASQPEPAKKAVAEGQKARQDALRQVLPSLSGSIKVSPDLFAPKAEPAEKTDSLAPVGATRAFDPVTVAEAESLDADEIVEDADDSSYEGQLTETGAFTGSEYVEMPKGRVGGLLGKLRRGNKKKGRKARRDEETSAQEWLDLEDGYDARVKGEELGTWSTRNTYGDDDGDGPIDNDAFDDSSFRPRSWNGGVFSRASLEKVRAKMGRGNADADEVIEGAYLEEDVAIDGEPEGGAGSSRRRRSRGGGVDALFADTSAEATSEAGLSADSEDDASAPRSERGRSERRQRRAARTAAATASEAPDADKAAAASVLDDVQAVHDFRLPDIDMEVWFVALGAELADNAGMKDFLDAHRDELKGAIIINVEAMGVGDLSVIDQEGMYFPVKPSSRMSRYARKAASALGMRVGDGTMLWRNSASTVALRQGCQAMHLACMAGDKPAYAASKEDTVENLSEDVMMANADFIVEVIKAI